MVLCVCQELGHFRDIRSGDLDAREKIYPRGTSGASEFRLVEPCQVSECEDDAYSTRLN